MKTNFITHKHFDKLVNVISNEFPFTKVAENTSTDYKVWNFDFIERSSVHFVIFDDGETALMVGVPGNHKYMWAETRKEFRRVKKQLIAACRKYR